jgi:hypothetical protein
VVVVAAASVAQPSPHGVDVEKLLDSVPITLETYGSVARPVPWTRVCRGFWCVFEGITGLSSDEWMTGEEPCVAPRPLIV